MKLLTRLLCVVTVLGIGMACAALVGSYGDQTQPARMEPKTIDPGPPGGPPSDAIVLFNGKDLSQWVGRDGGQAKWEVKDGVATVNGTGSIATKQEFGDAQLHVEWATPSQVKGEGQERGNSGVYLQSRYEVQVLDSYQNKTYFNGQAGAVYKQHVPLVNACRKPGEWQSYDIVFHAPAFDEAGGVIKRATITVLQNGVLIQDNVEVQGTTTHEGEPRYTKHAPKAPLQLQDHGNPVRFRNIWIRPL
jgi:3-keto-disaccharide hydrolase